MYVRVQDIEFCIDGWSNYNRSPLTEKKSIVAKIQRTTIFSLRGEEEIQNDKNELRLNENVDWRSMMI